MGKLNVMAELEQVTSAVRFIQLGARMSAVVAESSLPKRRLAEIYESVTGSPPKKGPSAHSFEWYLPRVNNVESSLFYCFYSALIQKGEIRRQAMIKGYEMYMERVRSEGREPQVAFQRAWQLVRYIEDGVLDVDNCRQCGGMFVVEPAHLVVRTPSSFVCKMCKPPQRIQQL